jgi:DNA-binding XRE family transcriptional regulator
MRLPEDFLCENNLVHFRAGCSWPQWKLALAVGIHPSRMSLLEQGAPPRPNEIEKLTKLFEVDLVEIWPDLETEAAEVRK